MDYQCRNLKFSNELFAFDTLNNKIFNQYIDSNNMQNKDNHEDNSSNLVLTPPPNLNSSINQFDNSSQFHDFKDSENVVKCKNYNLE